MSAVLSHSPTKCVYFAFRSRKTGHGFLRATRSYGKLNARTIDALTFAGGWSLIGVGLGFFWYGVISWFA